MNINELIKNRFNRPENKEDEFGFTNQYAQNNKLYNETAGQSFQAKSSYTFHEIEWDAKYKIPYSFRADGVTVFELDKIDEFEKI